MELLQLQLTTMNPGVVTFSRAQELYHKHQLKFCVKPSLCILSPIDKKKTESTSENSEKI